MGDLDMCCELPQHLLKEVLAWLPVECLCRFRSVCKKWNALFLSTKFITSKWAEKPPNKKPWLVVLNDVSFSASRFFNGTWKETSAVSLHFLRKGRKTKHPIYYCGSAAGLFLMNRMHQGYPYDFPPASTFIVCNPLTRTSLQLPPLSSIHRTYGTGIVGGGGDSRDTYEIVVMGTSKTGNTLTVEIYSSSDTSWRIAGHLPEDVQARETGLVFCAGSFYWPAVIPAGWVIVTFHPGEGTSIFVPLPNMAENGDIVPRILTCGSQLLLAGYVFGDRQELLQVILWGFEKVKVNSSSSTSSSSSSWKEIARMPQSDLERFSTNGTTIWCVGVGDCAIFIVSAYQDVTQVFSYSVADNIWSWLPRTSKTYEYIMPFEPRLDMKVG